MVNVAINGFGRIGKQFLMAVLEKKVGWKLHINHSDSLDHIVYSVKYDSVHPSVKNVKHDGRRLIIGEKKIEVSHELDPLKLPWKKKKIDLVIESTGVFKKRKEVSKHLKAGAKRVLISAPSDDCDICLVYGVNNSDFKKSHKIISAASCTTNCLTPLVKVIHENLGIKQAEFLTTHAYTSSQHLIDGDDRKDMRRGRAAGINIVPTSSGAAVSTVRVLPQLRGKISGYALRVPVIDGSITNLYAVVKKESSIEAINKLFKKEANKIKNVLEYTEDHIVSSDIIHNPHSCVFDSRLTQVSGKLVSVAGWYDNEWGYANRLVDLVKLICKK